MMTPELRRRILAFRRNLVTAERHFRRLVVAPAIQRLNHWQYARINRNLATLGAIQRGLEQLKEEVAHA